MKSVAILYFIDKLPNNLKVGKLDPLPENVALLYYRTLQKRKHHVGCLKYTIISIPGPYNNSQDFKKLSVFFLCSTKGQREVVNVSENIFVYDFNNYFRVGKKYMFAGKNYSWSLEKDGDPRRPLIMIAQIFYRFSRNNRVHYLVIADQASLTSGRPLTDWMRYFSMLHNEYLK